MSDQDPYPIPTTPEAQAMLMAMLGRDIRQLSGDVRALASTMATKLEMEAMRADLHKRIDALSAEFKKRDDVLAADVERKSLGQSLDRFLVTATRVVTFCLALVAFGGLVVGVVRYFDASAHSLTKGTP
jgi:hypothetical protein